MIPYLHLGPLNLPTFGLMVATGLLAASYILQADFRRRAIHADAFLVIGFAGLAGIVGARLYHVLESPSEFFANPWPLLISRFGFAWFGGFLGGFAALLLLGRREKIPTLTLLDACGPAACVGYAVGRIGGYVLKHKKPAGLVFCGYLGLTGIARFLVEIIRLNPRSFFGMSNAQAASVASVLLGVVLFFIFVRKPAEASPRPAAK